VDARLWRRATELRDTNSGNPPSRDVEAKTNALENGPGVHPGRRVVRPSIGRQPSPERLLQARRELRRSAEGVGAPAERAVGAHDERARLLVLRAVRGQRIDLRAGADQRMYAADVVG